MGKTFLLTMFLLAGISCQKSTDNTNQNGSPYEPPPGTLVTTGTLYYACTCLDGTGLFYVTDNQQTLLFAYENLADSNRSGILDDSLQNVYKDFLNTHSRLTYKNTGAVRCRPGSYKCEYDSTVQVVDLKSIN